MGWALRLLRRAAAEAGKLLRPAEQPAPAAADGEAALLSPPAALLGLVAAGEAQAVGLASNSSSRAAAASSTASDVLLAAMARQHSWQSCTACTSQDRRTCSAEGRCGDIGSSV